MEDTVVRAVVNKFIQRSEIGQKKYGTTLDRTDLSTLEWINHAQEEFMDGILYLEKLKRCVQPPAPVNEVIDNAPSSSSSEDNGDSEEEHHETYIYPEQQFRQAYRILCNKKRPRDEIDVQREQKKRKCADASISTASNETIYQDDRVLMDDAARCGEEIR